MHIAAAVNVLHARRDLEGNAAEIAAVARTAGTRQHRVQRAALGQVGDDVQVALAGPALLALVHRAHVVVVGHAVIRDLDVL